MTPADPRPERSGTVPLVGDPGEGPAVSVKEGPVPMSGPMVRAILDGRKTQTRRVVRPQPTGKTVGDQRMWTHETLAGDFGEHVFGACMAALSACPYGVPGDLLYVRENARLEFLVDPELYFARYQADDAEMVLVDIEDDAVLSWIERAKWRQEDQAEVTLWRPGMLVPKALCRLWLRVTDVRVERVQDITEEDARAEGARPLLNPLEVAFPPHVAGFADLWDSLNAKRGHGWDANPWVWKVSFERAESR